MNRHRKRLVNAGLIAISAVSLFDAFLGREDWPFSSYPMYSRVETATEVSKLRLVGVIDDGRDGEIVLLDTAYLAPFHKTRLHSAFRKLERRASDVELARGVADSLRRYRSRRTRREHLGPPLRALRIYEYHWTLRADASNRSRPDGRRLLVEVR